jgi:hypothetical protein
MFEAGAWPSTETLVALDATGYVALDAISHDDELASATAFDTLSKPHPFVVSSGGKFWVKTESQQGLCSELIGGRLAKATGTGPEAAIVRVDEAALPDDGSAHHLLGLGVGFAHENSTENSKKLAPLTQDNRFTVEMVNVPTYASVQVFYSWIGYTSDVQVLVNFQNGNIRGIDYGACFGNVANNTDPSLVVIDLPGLAVQVFPTRQQYIDAVDKVKAVTDDAILAAVCNMPAEAHWKSDLDRRRLIANWLRCRRDNLHLLLP